MKGWDGISETFTMEDADRVGRNIERGMRNRALEDAAKVCDLFADGDLSAADCATAIRNLKEEIEI